MASKIKKLTRPTLAQMMKTTTPRQVQPTQVHRPTKRTLIDKAYKRAEKEGY